MKIWLLQEDVNSYEHLTLRDADNDKWIEFGDLFIGNPLENIWEPMNLQLIPHSGILKRGDMPYLSPGVPVFSKRAKEVLTNMLSGNVEILDVAYEPQELYIVNVINLLEVINTEKSIIKYLSDGKRILRFIKYAFIADKLKDQHIFKIVEQPRADVFVSDEFRNKVIESGLEGFKFVEVWDSEAE